MLLVLTRETVLNAGALTVRQVPRRLLSLGVCAYPRGNLRGLFWRTVFEKSLPRYIVALLPFPIGIIARPDMALAFSQAPLPMFALVMICETYLLSVSSPDARRRLIDPVDAERGLDLLRVRAQAVLTRIASGRGLTRGTLHLVIEQSGLMRIPPLTYVSVQQDGPERGFLDLDRDERVLIAETLFDTDLDERKLRLINVARNEQLQTYALEADSVSAHARLAALARARGPSAPG